MRVGGSRIAIVAIDSGTDRDATLTYSENRPDLDLTREFSVVVENAESRAYAMVAISSR